MFWYVLNGVFFFFQWEDLGGDEGGKTVIRILYEKVIFNFKKCFLNVKEQMYNPDGGGSTQLLILALRRQKQVDL